MGNVETTVAGVILMCLRLTVATDMVTIEITGKGYFTIATDTKTVPKSSL